MSVNLRQKSDYTPSQTISVEDDYLERRIAKMLKTSKIKRNFPLSSH